MKDMLVSETKELFEQVEHLLLHHNINHTTIQFENNCCEDVEIIKKDN